MLIQKFANSFWNQVGAVLIWAALVGLFGIHTCIWEALADSTAVKRQGRYFSAPILNLKDKARSPEEPVSNPSEINGYDLIYEIIEDYKRVSDTSKSSIPGIENSSQSSVSTASVDFENLSILRMHQLNEILSSEEVFAEGLDLLLEERMTTSSFTGISVFKTLFEELTDAGLIKKSELHFVNKAIEAITEILVASRIRIIRMRYDFSMRSDQGSLLKMEKNILTYLDPQEIKKSGHDYLLLYNDFFKILQRIENSTNGMKIIHGQIF